MSNDNRYISYIATLVITLVAMFALAQKSYAGTQICWDGMDDTDTYNFDISVEKYGPDVITAGDSFVYNLYIHNYGPDNVDDGQDRYVRVTDTLPPGVTFLSAQIVGVNGNCNSTNVGDSTVTCDLDNLDNGQTAQIFVQVLSDATALANTFVIINNVAVEVHEVTPDDTTNTCDPADENNTDSWNTYLEAAADLEVTKACKPDTSNLNAGETATCTINVINHGPSAAQNVVLNDQIIANAGINIGDEITILSVNATAAGCPSAANINSNSGDNNVDVNQFACVFTNPLPGPTDPGSNVISVTYEFVSSEGADINNEATVDSTTYDPDKSNNIAHSGISYDSLADLVMDKQEPPILNGLVPGDSVTYTLLTTNNGPSSCSDLIVRDFIPSGLSVPANKSISAGSDCFANTPTLNCVNGVPGDPTQPLTCLIQGANIAAGQNCALVLGNLTVLPTATGTITNIADVRCVDTEDPILANNQDSVSDPVAATDLEITKDADPDPVVLAGNELFYYLTVENIGQSIAVDPTVVDTLPLEVSYLADTGGCTTLDASTLSCNLPDLGPGAKKQITIKTRVNSDAVVDDDNQTIVITNFAEVATVTTDENMFNNSAEKSTFVQAESDLKITKICKPDDHILAGEVAFCDIVVDNLGPSDARNVEMSDYITHDSQNSGEQATLTEIVASQGTCTTNLGDPPQVFAQGITVDCDLGNLSAIRSDGMNRAIVTVYLTATDDMDINDLGTVDSETADPDTSNNAAEGSINVDGLADLSVMKSDSPDPVTAGNMLTYDITIMNSGPSAAVNVIVSDVVPAGVTIQSVSGSDGAQCNAGVPGNPALPTECAFDTIEAGGTRTMQIVVTVNPDTIGIIFNDVTVSSDTYDDNNANNFDSEPTTVEGLADLRIDKRIVTPASGDPSPGNPLEYVLVVTNDGPSQAQNVVVTDDLPDEVDYIDFESVQGFSDCTLVDEPTNLLECELGNMDPGDVRIIKINTIIPPDTPNDVVLDNCAIVTSDTADPDGVPDIGQPVTTNNEDCADVTTSTEIDLWVEKTSNFPTGNSSGTIQYFCTVHNDNGCSTIPDESDGSPVCGTGGPADLLPGVSPAPMVRDLLPLNAKKLVVQYWSPGCNYVNNCTSPNDSNCHWVDCPIVGGLPYGSSISFEIQVDAKGSSGTLYNECRLLNDSGGSIPTCPPGGDWCDPDNTNNSHTIKTIVQGGTGDTGGPGGNRGRSSGPNSNGTKNK